MTSIRKFSVSKKSLFVSRVHLFAFLIVCVTVSSLFVGGATAATYSGSCGDNLTWTLTEETGVLEITGSGKMVDYSTPRNTGWYTYRDNITTVSLCSNVTSIGSYAFYNCSNLTSVTIGEGVESIGSYAFSYSNSLTSIEIPNNVKSIQQQAFSFCTVLSNLTIPENVTSIGEYAFFHTALTSIVIPDSVTSIEYGAFRDCYALKTVIIGNGVTSIGQSLFSYCSNLTSVTIGRSVTSIGESAFAGCSSLISIDIPDSVTSIGESAFAGCSSLISIDIPDNVTSIGDCAFDGCSSLTSVTIGNNVTSIGRYAFAICSSLVTIDIPDNVTIIENGTFAGCLNLTFIKIGDGVTSIGDYAFSDCPALASLIIPDGITTIGEGAFRGCSALTCIILPNRVSSLGAYAFWGCLSLISVDIPESVTSIGEYAFSYCSNLEVVDLSSTTALSSVGDSAFGYWNGNSAMKSGSVIYVSDERTAALFIAGTNYYAPNTRIIVGKPTQEITYLIKYDANGGNGNMVNQTFTYNTTQNLSINTFVKNASVFSGWSTIADGPVIYTDGQSVRNLLTIDGAILTLYAVWKPDENPNVPDFSLSLMPGWNFISVPQTLNTTENTAGFLFSSVDTSNKNILGYNTQTGTWVPIIDEMEIIRPLNGYWIYAAAGTMINLTYPSSPTLPSVKTLYPGWNAIGLSADECTMTHNALVCLNSSWKTVIPWNLSAGKYDSAIVNGGLGPNSPERLMTLGNGYWLYVDAQCTLTGLTA